VHRVDDVLVGLRLAVIEEAELDGPEEVVPVRAQPALTA